MFRKENKAQLKRLEKKDWLNLSFYGLVFIALTQGAMFLGLSLLPSVTVSLMLNFTPIVVAVMGIFLISEIPTKQQWFGTSLFILGILVYFYPIDLPESEWLGIIVMSFGVLFNAGSSVLGRYVNMGRRFSPVIITTISMTIGAVVLLITGVIVQGFPQISLLNLLLLLWDGNC